MTARKDQQAATRARVLEAARACFIVDGYAGATIRGIAERAGVSIGGVFSSFTGKADLYRTVYGHDPISPEAARDLLAALRRLTLMARTSAGTPGPDAGLMRACEQAEATIAQAEAH